MNETIPSTIPEPTVAMPEQRLHGLDLLRMLSMIAIVINHAHEVVWYTHTIPFSPGQSIYFIYEFIARHLAFSGFTIVALGTFVLGWKPRNPKKVMQLLIFLALGCVLLAWVEGNGPTGFYWEWDIYEYLVVSVASVLLIQSSGFLVSLAAFTGAVLLWVPFWNIWTRPLAGAVWYSALIGDCTHSGGGGWPLLPWIGLIWIFFAWGWAYRKLPKFKAAMRGLGWLEGLAWAAVLIPAARYFDGYSHVIIGDDWGCYTFRRPPYIFWSHLVWITFAMRISLILPLNRWLSRIRFAEWISSLHWSRRFYRCYVIELLVIGVLSMFTKTYLAHPRLWDVALTSIWPLTEYISRGWEAVMAGKVKWLYRRIGLEPR